MVTDRRLRIAIVSKGRFHLLDLARELAALGHDVKFYSYVPRKMAAGFGLAPRYQVCLLWYVLPLVYLERRGPPRLRRLWGKYVTMWMDRLVSARLEPCDVFVGLSGLCVKTGRIAKRKFGARVFTDRGSMHILTQKEILDRCKARFRRANTVPGFAVERELVTYEQADVIAVPSWPALKSFLDRGVPEEKMFRNPYGVDTGVFRPTPVPALSPPVVLYVGNWTYEKGCDVLVDAVRRLGKPVRLVHVGAVGDAPLPAESWFEHVDPVPQHELAHWYGRATVFVLASRQEGFGMVLLQAAACGVPIVCTPSGGVDLREMVDDKRWIAVVPSEDAAALAREIERMLELAKTQAGLRDYLGERRVDITWSAYGRRYESEILRRL